MKLESRVGNGLKWCRKLPYMPVDSSVSASASSASVSGAKNTTAYGHSICKHPRIRIGCRRGHDNKGMVHGMSCVRAWAWADRA